jgi:hypothetical protein
VDLALEREFPLGAERRLTAGVSAYNALNHPAFGNPAGYLDSPLFGAPATALNSMLGMGTPHSGLTPALQTGGPRSLQITLRLRF